ncbi:LuxR C-terminal-related transcriptional regulator [Erwinia sp. S63]|uniref:helix-turn-helix transcriptional regulator n=1 Tax=Erwinia sp. S63 TaxID=2769341 RepID=UPI00257424DD|nr:LuxR C-terminal-related transcriptional regulator [Erwinia sp. S63]
MAEITSIQNDAFICRCLENFTQLIPGSIGVFYLVDEKMMPYQHVRFGIPEEMHQAYMRDFISLDPFHPMQYASQPVSFAGLDESSRKSAYYRQFMKPHTVGDSIEVYVRKNRQIVAGLSLMRDKVYSQQERMRLRAMLPLIELATEELLPRNDEQRLTPKEQVIVDMIREGACNKRIANHLDISLSTVKTHLRNIFSKTHASNRTELLRNVNASWYAERVS